MKQVRQANLGARNWAAVSPTRVRGIQKWLTGDSRREHGAIPANHDDHDAASLGALPIALGSAQWPQHFSRSIARAASQPAFRETQATNRDLHAAVAGGSFRSDLFYRLQVFPIGIPPLRERREDIPLLVEYFVDRYTRKAGKSIKHINKKTLELLQSYPWPGNIRELQNVIERSVILCESDIFAIDENWLPQALPATESKCQLEPPRRLEAQENNIIEEALEASRGRVFGPAGAAAMLGIPRSALKSKFRALKIDKYLFKTDTEG